MVKAPLLIYDAAAGSGKTFTLVKEYLKLILRSREAGYYKNVLAITFTNKAVAEMKARILENLVSFSEVESRTNPSAMMVQIAEETQTTPHDIQQQSKKIVKHLLHHYAGFAVETIDRFNHTLIRTFARDLALASNFEVSLDTDQLLAEAVDQLISKAGESAETTQLLIDYALEKTDDDKSWDISKDITKASKLIFDENEAPHLAKLKDKSVTDFQNLKTALQKKRATYLSEIKTITEITLQTISEAGLESSDFNGGSRAYFPSYLQKLATSNLAVTYGASWQESMGEKPLYPKSKTTDIIAQTIDALTPQFIEAFEQTQGLVTHVWLYDTMLKNLTPLSVINLVYQELQRIKEEKNILPISEFNSIINREIKNQPAPFIYERLGERYRHFFIDEFQDTSLLQWENLIPLVDNSLSQETPDGTKGSLLLVGDAKQSIYRWRGGLPEQFIALTQKKHPFSVPQIEVENLPINFRSCQEIVQFNNRFFTTIARYFGSEAHSELYLAGNQQEQNAKKGGYVEIEFVEKEDKHARYGKRVLDTITKLVQNGFSKRDICVLTRGKKDGIALSAFLMEHNIDVVSSETLLLQYSPLVQCIMNTLTLSVYPENDEVKINLLDFLHGHLDIAQEKHSFFSYFLGKPTVSFSKLLQEQGIEFSLEMLNEISLYESCEYIINHFDLSNRADAYLFGFIDFVFDFEQRPQADKIGFLDFWETKKTSASVTAGQGTDAIQFMTIHKAKGLEFPVVIFPYADVTIHKEIEGKTWFPLEPSICDFDEARINFSKQVDDFGAKGRILYQQRREQLELDAYNLLYVTLTRAVEQLYIFTEVPATIKDDLPKSFCQLFSEFLKEIGHWNNDQVLYSFGSFQKKQQTGPEQTVTQVALGYLSSPPEEHELHLATKEAFLWQTEAAEAISEGNILHETMAQIENKEDVTLVLEDLATRSILPATAIKNLEITITKLISHPDLKGLFEGNHTVKNEREIITQDGRLLIPDRLNFDDNNVTVLDYKTGSFSKKHVAQINEYAQALEEMDFTISEKIIVYIIEAEIVINKV